MIYLCDHSGIRACLRYIEYLLETRKRATRFYLFKRVDRVDIIILFIHHKRSITKYLYTVWQRPSNRKFNVDVVPADLRHADYLMNRSRALVSFSPCVLSTLPPSRGLLPSAGTAYPDDALYCTSYPHFY